MPWAIASTAARQATPHTPACTPGGGRANQTSARTRGAGAGPGAAATATAASSWRTTQLATGHSQKWWRRPGRRSAAPQGQGWSACSRAAVGSASYTSRQRASFRAFSQGSRQSWRRVASSSARGEEGGGGRGAGGRGAGAGATEPTASSTKGTRYRAARSAAAVATSRAVASRTARDAKKTGLRPGGCQPRRGSSTAASTADGAGSGGRSASASACRAAATHAPGRAASNSATRSRATCRSAKA